MKGNLSLLFLLAIAVPAIGQYYERCLTVSGFSDDPDNGNGYNFKSTIRYNSSKEFVMVGDSKLFRVSKEGSKLWERTVSADIDDYGIDDAGNVLAIHNNATRLIKYNANGNLAWEKTFSTQLVYRIVTDNSNNVYVTGHDNTSGLLLIKYSSAGTLLWQKTIGGGIGNALVVSTTGDVYVVGYDFTNGGSMLLKYSSDGTLQWQSAINNNISARYLKLGPDNNLYAFLYDEFTSVIYKINPTTGITVDNIILDYGNIVAQFGPGNTIFVLGTLGNGRHSIFKISTNFTGDVFRDLQTFVYRSFDYKSLEVEADGTVTANVISGFDERSSTFYRMNASGEYIDDVLQFEVPNTGHAVDDQGSYLLATDYDCLKKLTPCGKVAFSISAQPTSATVCQGSDAQFTFSVSGEGLLYQWKKGSVILTNSTKYAGVNSATLTVRNANPIDDAGSFTCEVFDACYVPLASPERKLTSQVVSINFTTASSISAQPLNVSQCAGGDAVFQISTSGGQNVKYQWKKGASALTESPTVVGTKTNILTLKGITSADAVKYYCEVTSDCFDSPLISQEASLTVLGSTSISNPPVAVSTCVGSTAIFEVVAVGADITYQWMKGTTSLTENSFFIGTKSAVLSINNIKVGDAGSYSCVVTGLCGAPVTSSAALNVTPSVQITQQPVNKEICSGGATTFSVVATGPILSYSWRKGNTTLTNGGKYSGVNTATLNISSTTTAEEGQYSCAVSATCGSDAISTVGQLSIGNAPVISGTSPDLIQCEGEVAKMSVSVSAGEVAYQWKKDGSALADGEGIVGSTTKDLFISSVKGSDVGSYTCEVSSGCGTVQVSGVIKLELANELVIEQGMKIQQGCNGGEVSMVVRIVGQAQRYQWKKNGVNVSNSSFVTGATTATLSLANTTFTDQGFYTCEVESDCGKILLTDPIQLQINPKPSLSLIGIDCEQFPAEWSSIVIDNNNVFGDYLIFRKGNSDALNGLQSAVKSGVYVIVKEAGVCSDSIEWNNDCIITAVEHKNSNLAVTPNPSKGLFNVGYTAPHSFEVYDSRGMQVLKNEMTSEVNTAVDGSHLANGIYFLILVTDDGQRISKRILIQR